MFCSKCGEILPENAKFCTACGAKVEKHSTVVNDVPQFEHHQPKGKMKFTDAIVSFFVNLANFDGRARRAEFWWVALALGLLNALIEGNLPAGMLQYTIGLGVNASLTLKVWEILFFVPRLSLSVRRLHDVGKSWKYLLWMLCPVAGQIMLLIQFCKEGDHGDNAYGPDPKLCC